MRGIRACVPISLSAPTPPFLYSCTFSTFSPCGAGAPPLNSGSVVEGSASCAAPGPGREWQSRRHVASLMFEPDSIRGASR